MSTILVVSNGFGEDGIAVNLCKAFQKQVPETVFLPLPMVGQGKAYQQATLAPVLTNPTLPSGGFIRTFFDLKQDLKAGLIRMHWRQFQTAKSLRRQADFCLCVGDVFCLVMGILSGCRTLYFLPTAKSDKFMKHSAIEIWLMKRYAKAVFPRDAETTASLRQAGVPAFFWSNPMFDHLTPTGKNLGLSKAIPVVGILPGSRQEAYQNLAFCLELATQKPDWQWVVALSPHLDLKTIAQEANRQGWTSVASQSDCSLILTHASHSTVRFSPDFTDVLDQTQVLIGLSGTANEQAVACGKTVVAFEGFGPQSSALRFQEQQLLLGQDQLWVVNRDPEAIIEALCTALAQTTIAPKPKRESGSDAIVDSILKAEGSR
ncbi:MAG: lipid-A-disaccharide synthase-related protein [Candidatus Margulisiibacteriota bacterium]